MLIDVLTLFPEVFEPMFSSSIIGRAGNAGLVDINCTNIRDFATDKHKSVDDRPFGGGPGMVLMCGPVFDCFDSVEQKRKEDFPDKAKEPCRIILTPQGERLTHSLAQSLSQEDWLVIICGHYEGFDERIREGFGGREISIGDYVLSGGEPAAMVLVDSVIRLLPGALGDENSAKQDTFSEGLLEHPQYTRPRSFRGMEVPEILLSGDHAKIEAWRNEKRLERTRARRPDLLSDEEAD